MEFPIFWIRLCMDGSDVRELWGEIEPGTDHHKSWEESPHEVPLFRIRLCMGRSSKNNDITQLENPTRGREHQHPVCMIRLVPDAIRTQVSIPSGQITPEQ